MNLAHQLRHTLEQEIVRGDFPPGAHLDELKLAERFKVSRTPIRDALTQLTVAGLIERRPRRGAVVASVPFEKLLEMFEVMAELEGLAARLAARRYQPMDRAEIIAAHEACRDAAARNDRDDYYYKNERFHQAIQAASHSNFLMEQCAALSLRLRPYRRLQLDTCNRIEVSFSEHEKVVEAILLHEANQAATRMKNHILIQGERFGDLMAALKTRGIN